MSGRTDEREANGPFRIPLSANPAEPPPADVPPRDVHRCQLRVTQHQAHGTVRGTHGSAVAHQPQRDSDLGGTVGETCLGTVPFGQPGDDVEPGGDTAHLGTGEVLGQRGGQGVAARPVGALAAPQLTVVVAPCDEIGEHRLVDGRVAEVHRAFAVDDLVGHRRRCQQPPQPQTGCQRFAHGAGVHDVFRIQPLQRPDGRPVVAEVTVVVVLHDHPVDVPRPVQEAAPAGGGVRDSGGELVGRCGHHGTYPGARQRLRGQPFVIERQRGRSKARRGEERGVFGAPRILDTDGAHPAFAQHEPEQRRRLRHARTDQQALRIGHHPATPRQQGRQRDPQLGQSTWIRIAQGAVRQPAERRTVGRAQALRGKSERSGVPGRKSTRVPGPRGARSRARSAAARTDPLTQVPAPRPLCR